ncbi:MAG: DUF814 domain-containing protein [Halobacteriovoraceae bacterium]|nr:DUF814 domain-containing protein [Halobacteriovoraceae bacterium]MCB9094148.1 DUF814 domain-containing protein [Halobacteriovoraceae bacterium]
MIQNYNTLKNQTIEIQKAIASGSFIQKIYSTGRYIAISLRSPGKTWWLYLGRGGGFEGVWLSEKQPDSELRTRDTLLEYLRKHFTGGIFHSLEVDKKDRIISFQYYKWGKVQKFFYFWRGRESYFVDARQSEDSRKLLLSWNGEIEFQEIDFDIFDDIGREDISKEQKISFQPIENLLAEEIKNYSGKKEKKKWERTQKRKVQNIEGDLKKIRAWKTLQTLCFQYRDELNEKGSCLSLEKLQGKCQVAGIRFQFTSQNNSFQKLDVIFQKIKRLKLAEPFILERLEKEQAKLQNKSHEKSSYKIKTIMPVWKITLKKNKEKKSLEGNFYESLNFKVAAGKSAQSNDELRTKWAKKGDFWFHIDNVPSAHLYVKCLSKISFELPVLQILGSLLRDCSGYVPEEVPLLYTEVKNLKGVKGKPGSVHFKKEKRVTIHYTTSWKNEFKQSD